MRTKKVLILFLLLTVLSIPIFANEISFNPGEEVVATVNGEDISLSQLDQYANIEGIIMEISQLDQEFAQLVYSSEAGQELQNEYKKSKLDELINENLLTQEAQMSGIELSLIEKEEIFDNHIKMVKEQNNIDDEELLSILRQQQGIESMEEYKELLMSDDGLIINKFLEEEVFSQISVSDDELMEVYENNEKDFIEQGVESFEDIKEMLKNDIRQQKQQQLLNSYLIELRNEAEIEINI